MTPEAPVVWMPPVLEGLGVPLHPLRRDWDAACWPLATRGFFGLRAEIPALLRALSPRPPLA